MFYFIFTISLTDFNFCRPVYWTCPPIDLEPGWSKKKGIKPPAEGPNLRVVLEVSATLRTAEKNIQQGYAMPSRSKGTIHGVAGRGIRGIHWGGLAPWRTQARTGRWQWGGGKGGGKGNAPAWVNRKDLHFKGGGGTKQKKNSVH